jgi:hypothetical protein
VVAMTSTLELESLNVRESFDNIARLEQVARELPPEQAAQAKTIIKVAYNLLGQVGPIRPKIAGELLSVSERTVRNWLNEGVLVAAEGEHRRVLLDPGRVHEVLRLVRALRVQGKKRNLVEAVWMRLQDEALLDRPDLQESLEQMRRGEVVPA